jgi:hypothetical protein
MQVYKSIYSIEGAAASFYSICNISMYEKCTNKYDIESHYRFYNLDFKMDKVRQTSAMYHIWVASISVRFNLDFLMLVLFTIFF